VGGLRLFTCFYTFKSGHLFLALLLISAASFSPLTAIAATHDVTVGNNLERLVPELPGVAFDYVIVSVGVNDVTCLERRVNCPWPFIVFRC
jgi:hypothetical protein